MTRELQDQGFVVGRRRVARLMWENGMHARPKRRFKKTTDSHHAFPVAPNIIVQDFTTTAPNQKWGADISCIWTRESWLYLAVVIDFFARRVVGWAVSDRLHRRLALQALKMALTMRRPSKGLDPPLRSWKPIFLPRLSGNAKDQRHCNLYVWKGELL